MTDIRPPRAQFPPVPDGCGILPVAEHRIASDPTPDLLSSPSGDLSPLDSGSELVLNDGLEQVYRRVLARALALAAGGLFLVAFVAVSLIDNQSMRQTFIASQLFFRAIFFFQILFTAFCVRFVEKLPTAAAAVLLFSYAAFCGMEFSALVSPSALSVAFLCAGLMYAATALWGFIRHADLARPVTPIFMILTGGAILVIVNQVLGTSASTWTLSSVLVVVFAYLLACHAQEIRDFYQDFDDDNVEGWKASVLGALLLMVNLLNLFLLVANFFNREETD